MTLLINIIECAFKAKQQLSQRFLLFLYNALAHQQDMLGPQFSRFFI